jgi:hypothetical protein
MNKGDSIMPIKLSTRTLLSHLIKETVKEWKLRLPDKPLEAYDNWEKDIVDKIAFQLSKKGINIDEVIVDIDSKTKEE